MSALRLDSTLLPAAPLMSHADLDEIIESMIECGAD
jgi:hypothetical protein